MAQLSSSVIVSARVLGLRKILRRKPNSLAPAAMAGLRELLGTLKTAETALLIEDRIVLLCPVVDDQWTDQGAGVLADLLAELSGFQLRLATEGFFLSGAITWGLALFDRTQGRLDLSGPGVRRAQRLARTHPGPCLLIDPDLAIRASMWRSPAEHPAWLHIQDNGWGQYIWDYLSFAARIGEGPKALFGGILDLHKRAVEGVMTGKPQGTRRAPPPWKAWLACYHDRVVRRAASASGDRSAVHALMLSYGVSEIDQPLLAQGGFQPEARRLVQG